MRRLFRFSLVLLALLLAGPSPAARLGCLTAPVTPVVSVRVYLNPNTGRFWTMDSFEGVPYEPTTLHR